MLTFDMVDRIFKEYGLIPYPLEDGTRTEYAFENRQSITGKKNVATNVSTLLNGGVRGYIYVGYQKNLCLKRMLQPDINI